jgi:hypothetical protein
MQDLELELETEEGTIVLHIIGVVYAHGWKRVVFIRSFK